MLKYSNMQNLFVNIVIILLENIKDYLFYLCIRLQKISNRLYRNFSRFFLRKMKSPVEIQQKAILFKPLSDANSKQDI